ncbi:MAG TPA: PAC2 family protein [Acidimicrobiia bacterium]
MAALVWESRPELPGGILVAAFTGWNDAGDAASDAVGWLRTHSGAEPFASIDPDEHYDFQAHRPEVRITDGVTREISWPTLEFAAASASGSRPGLVLLSGPEPNLRWRGFCDTVIEVARETGCSTVVTFGALLADTPHTAPIRVSGSTTDAAAMARLGLEPSRYEGPTGIVGVLHDTCRNAGFRSASFWAPVPHYVATPPNPPATRALLERFAAFTEHPLDLRELGVAADAWRARVDGAVAGDEEMGEYVRGLEAQLEESLGTIADAPASEEDIPSGDDLAQAFEDYLREQGDEP